MPVYCIQAGESGPVAFIRHKGATFVRRDLQRGMAARLVVLRSFDGGIRAQQWLQDRFADLGVDGRWHTFSDEMLTIDIPADLTNRHQLVPDGAVGVDLTDGWRTFIDPADIESLAGRKWFVKRGGSGNKLYAGAWDRAESGKLKMVFLHRALLQAPAGVDVDHANGDGLDNRRKNLRLATRSQNIANLQIAPRSSSGYRGVFAHKNGRFYACVHNFNHVHRLGGFASAIEAALAYDKRAHEVFGEFAALNFPDLRSAA